MQNKTLYIEWFKTMLPNAAIYITAIVLLIFMPVKSYWSILFLGLSLTLSLKLYSDIVSNTKPSWKEYNKTTTTTVFFISLTSLLYSVGGWFGIFGLGLVIIIFAGYRIYQQFDLFDNLTTYISDVLFKGKSYDFDPQKKKDEEVLKDESSRENRGESVGDTQQRRSEGIENETTSIVDSSDTSEESLSFLQKQDVVIYREETKSGSPEEPLHNVPENLPKVNNALNKKRKKKKKKKVKKIEITNEVE